MTPVSGISDSRRSSLLREGDRMRADHSSGITTKTVPEVVRVTSRGRTVLTLIRKARQRLLYNELLSQGSAAVCAALVALILLLVLGTQILNWYWAVLIPAAAAVVAAYRVGKRLPGLYPSAQVVDRRMDLADALSTAVYFSGNPGAPASPELCRLQREQAERVAETIDVRKAVPYTVPRSAYAVAALVVVASSLFALRYGLSRRLDLGQPMARILEQALGFENPQTARVPPRKNLAPGDSKSDGDSLLQADQPTEDANQHAGDPLEENDAKNQAASQADKNSREEDAKSDGQKGDEPGQGGQRSADDNASDRSGSDKDSQNQQQGSQNSNGSKSSSSLLSKVKEAMQNLLSSMKPQSSANSQPSDSAQNGKQKGQQNAGKQSQKGEKTTGQAGGDQQDPDLNSESQQAENSPGQGDDAKPSNKQPGGGIGSRDGSKDVKQAEQLAAMGKISQIIGKRSANLSGEATIEVQSTAQQLRTAYSDRAAQHTDAGAEIGRDEIPVALESYVEQYFEQVRKQPAPKKETPGCSRLRLVPGVLSILHASGGSAPIC